MAALFSLVGRGIFPVIRKEYECITDTESYFVVFSYANKICLNINLQRLFSYLVVPRNILQLCFWRAEAVLQHSPPPSLHRPSGLEPWWCIDITAKYVNITGCTRSNVKMSITCPPELNPLAQLPTYLQREADLQSELLSPNRPGPVWCGSRLRPVAPVCPPGQKGFGQTVK